MLSKTNLIRKNQCKNSFINTRIFKKYIKLKRKNDYVRLKNKIHLIFIEIGAKVSHKVTHHISYVQSLKLYIASKYEESFRMMSIRDISSIPLDGANVISQNLKFFLLNNIFGVVLLYLELFAPKVCIPPEDRY